MLSKEEIERRFWLRVDKTHSCWRWDKHSKTNGNRFQIRGEVNIQAHYYAWDLEHHEILGPRALKRLCHRPDCVNPAHYKKKDPKPEPAEEPSEAPPDDRAIVADASAVDIQSEQSADDRLSAQVFSLLKAVKQSEAQAAMRHATLATAMRHLLSELASLEKNVDGLRDRIDQAMASILSRECADSSDKILGAIQSMKDEMASEVAPAPPAPPTVAMPLAGTLSELLQQAFSTRVAYHAPWVKDDVRALDSVFSSALVMSSGNNASATRLLESWLGWYREQTSLQRLHPTPQHFSSVIAEYYAADDAAVAPKRAALRAVAGTLGS